ncbi:aminoglycoside phosphotransferase family protein [Pseudoalteromonas sp. SMS1]|uniref:aminoglycoside phosphotransferase family protein n=1 Tax=Pseudoalteromonas sp. SMS1 TaxID=2908894 RepID=UPI001F1B10D6|nr:aminoglycoside phosphotransferase family protein [Pseudoalteromonas sp. SMS1]MCF2856057.1 aminoglycoside phosphotransferase family protein [Pseudoalteromonas sp. SMS1]
MQSSLYKEFLELANRSQDRVNLWNGCGTLERFVVNSHCYVAKISSVPNDLKHRVIEQSSFSLKRKVRSYEKEQLFYKQYSGVLNPLCTVPKVYELHKEQGTFVTILADFRTLGFENKASASFEDIVAILTWLAGFHAIWLEQSTSHSLLAEFGEGNYWHFKTRPDEFKKMPGGPLKQHAQKIDQILTATTFKTLIHGDAKLANFAFNNKAVIGYDFQHVGVGIGLSDVMLLLTSVLECNELEALSDKLLDIYFMALANCMAKCHVQLSSQDVEREWRPLWPLIWADFHRFLVGWKPDHKKINHYMKYQSKKLPLFL